jgi:restriction endonuclease
LINELTVVTDESYTAFVEGLQRELSETPGARPGKAGAYPLPSDGRKPRRPLPREANTASRAPFEPVELDSDDLIGRSVAAMNRHLKVDTLRYVVRQGQAGPVPGGDLTTIELSAHTGTVPAGSPVAYDLIGEVAARTRLTRRTVASILSRVSAATFAQYRQNPDQFIAASARLINAQLTLISGHTRPSSHRPLVPGRPRPAD